MICYGVLIAAALFVLLPARNSNEVFLLFVSLLFFALLIIRTIIHSSDEDME
jgi:4-hydroxybenzoate polyprenyltransferase